MKCSKCGYNNKPNATFCAQCGTKLIYIKSVDKTSSPYVSPSSQGRTVFSAQPPQVSGSGEVTEIIVGRAAGSDIVINDQAVSGKHSKIFVENDTLYIEDLKSLNGTYVNGKRVIGKIALGMNSRVTLGTSPLDLRHPLIYNLLIKYGTSGITEKGILNIKLNQKWLGKIFFFLMILLMFFPWLTMRSGGISFSYSALDFAFNRSNIETFSGKADYGALHTVFLILFIIMLMGLVMNFFIIRISNKFNFVNIISVVIFIISIAYLFLINELDNTLSIIGISLKNGISVFLFIFISFISIFEGLFEYFIAERNKYLG